MVPHLILRCLLVDLMLHLYYKLKLSGLNKFNLSYTQFYSEREGASSLRE